MVDSGVTQYEIETLGVLPTVEPIGGVHYFKAGAAQSVPTTGLILLITSEAFNSWIGVFAFDYKSPVAKTEIIRFAASPTCCVVAGGQGYVIRVDAPTGARSISAYPILSIAQSADSLVCAFADFTRVTVVSGDGAMWDSRRLSWDGVEVTSISEKEIRGLGWDAPRDVKVPFVIDLASRSVTGGASLPDSR